MIGPTRVVWVLTTSGFSVGCAREGKGWEGGGRERERERETETETETETEWLRLRLGIRGSLEGPEFRDYF